MELNFFQWFRDAIRKTVLLGVSDAMQSLGTPEDTDDVHPQLASLIVRDQDRIAETPKRASGKTGGKAAPRKRLGKSLKELNP